MCIGHLRVYELWPIMFNWQQYREASCLHRVQLTVVGLDGKRHTVRGLEGQALVNVLHANQDTFGEEGEFFGLAVTSHFFKPGVDCASRSV